MSVETGSAPNVSFQESLPTPQETSAPADQSPVQQPHIVVEDAAQDDPPRSRSPFKTQKSEVELVRELSVERDLIAALDAKTQKTASELEAEREKKRKLLEKVAEMGEEVASGRSSVRNSVRTSAATTANPTPLASRQPSVIPDVFRQDPRTNHNEIIVESISEATTRKQSAVDIHAERRKESLTIEPVAVAVHARSPEDSPVSGEPKELIENKIESVETQEIVVPPGNLSPVSSRSRTTSVLSTTQSIEPPPLADANRSRTSSVVEVTPTAAATHVDASPFAEPAPIVRKESLTNKSPSGSNSDIQRKSSTADTQSVNSSRKASTADDPLAIRFGRGRQNSRPGTGSSGNLFMGLNNHNEAPASPASRAAASSTGNRSGAAVVVSLDLKSNGIPTVPRFESAEPVSLSSPVATQPPPIEPVAKTQSPFNAGKAAVTNSSPVSAKVALFQSNSTGSSNNIPAPRDRAVSWVGSSRIYTATSPKPSTSASTSTSQRGSSVGVSSSFFAKAAPLNQPTSSASSVTASRNNSIAGGLGVSDKTFASNAASTSSSRASSAAALPVYSSDDYVPIPRSSARNQAQQPQRPVSYYTPDPSKKVTFIPARDYLKRLSVTMA